MLPAAQTTLPFLENLITLAVRERSGDGRFRVEEVRLSPSTILIRLGMRNMTKLLDGSYGLELHILETGPARTRFEARWEEPGGLARLVGLGAKLLPRGLLNEALQRLFGGWIRVEGEHVVLHHAEMIASLARKSGSGSGGDPGQSGSGGN